MTRPASVFLLSALLLAAPLPALAGGLNLGTVARVPAVSGFSSRIGPAPSGISGYAGPVSGAGMSVTNSEGVTLQTNIDATRNVQAGSQVSVNETVNGVPVGYGVGEDFLAGADAQGQAAWADQQAQYQQMENQVSLAVQVWQGQGN